MEAEVKSTKRFVPPRVGIFLKIAKICNFDLELYIGLVFNLFNVYFQQKLMFVYVTKALTLTVEQIEILKK